MIISARYAIHQVKNVREVTREESSEAENNDTSFVRYSHIVGEMKPNTKVR